MIKKETCLVLLEDEERVELGGDLLAVQAARHVLEAQLALEGEGVAQRALHLLRALLRALLVLLLRLRHGLQVFKVLERLGTTQNTNPSYSCFCYHYVK